MHAKQNNKCKTHEIIKNVKHMHVIHRRMTSYYEYHTAMLYAHIMVSLFQNCLTYALTINARMKKTHLQYTVFY